MGALSPFLRSVEGNRIAFWCPGCKSAHQVGVGERPGPRWTWNGDCDRPTFKPSILVRWGCKVPGNEGWCKDGSNEPCICGVCHSFVTDGRIEFLGDCTHDLAGQTVDLPSWPNGDDA